MIRSDMADFFISYTGADKQWAEWIGYVLEEAGFRVILQAWDFAPGANFVLEMHNATANAQRTIAVISPDYMKSAFGSSEWAVAFAQDPEGTRRTLVPVRVRECPLDGLLRTIVHIDLFGLAEDEAGERLLSGLGAGRRKPSIRPAYPGSVTPSPFPGRRAASSQSASPTRPYIPKIRQTYSDLERKRFAVSAFKAICAHFDIGLNQLRDRHPEIEIDLEQGNSEVIAEAFVNGKSKSRCRIWLGGIFGENTISYAEGRHMGQNSCNESLHVTDEQGSLALAATMAIGVGRATEGVDIQHLSPEDAAEYLWRRFISILEQ